MALAGAEPLDVIDDLMTENGEYDLTRISF
jgi:hypothetical protein